MLVEGNPDDEDLAKLAFEGRRIANEMVVGHMARKPIDYLIGSGPHAKDLPQLILLDLKLPKVDGLEVLKRLRANSRIRRLM